MKLGRVVTVAVPALLLLHAGVGHAETVQVAGAGASDRALWAEYRDGWHEFFLMSGTAAVTLAGLLFVALSLHIETLIHETREHLLWLARATLLSFTMVLVLSLMMLVPGQSIRVASVELALLGIVFAAITLRQIRRRLTTEHADFSTALFRRRLIMPLIGYAIVAATGVAMFKLRSPYLMITLIGAVCMLLGNASGTSWDLLVRTAKIKRRAEGDAARNKGPAAQ